MFLCRGGPCRDIEDPVSAEHPGHPCPLLRKDQSPLYPQGFKSGIDGVLVSGCHPGDCHYLSGNYVGKEKVGNPEAVSFEYLGIEEGRVQFSWVSAAEGIKFSQVIEEVTQDIKKLGPAKAIC